MINIFKKTEILKENLNNVEKVKEFYSNQSSNNLTEGDWNNIRTIISLEYNGRIKDRTKYVENKIKELRGIKER